MNPQLYKKLEYRYQMEKHRKKAEQKIQKDQAEARKEIEQLGSG